MTCIVGHVDGWMVADDRMVWGDFGVGPFVTEKITKWYQGRILVGLCGAADRVYSRVTPEHYSRSPLDILPSIMRDIDDEDFSALICRKGELGVISGHGVYHRVRPSAHYWAVGSGTDAALGYLCAVDRQKGLIVPGDAMLAIDFVSMINNSVGKAIQVVVCES